MTTKPWPLFGYAPGNYQNRCCDCRELFFGDKRAFMCLDCAASRANRALDLLRREAAIATITELGEVMVPDREEFAAMFSALPEVPHGGLKCIEVYGAPNPALAVRIVQLEEALKSATGELREAADKFWVVHCNYPGKAVGRQQGEDKDFCATMSQRMAQAAKAGELTLNSSHAEPPMALGGTVDLAAAEAEENS